MKLTQEEYNKLQEIDSELGHAINDSYFRVVNRKMLQDYAAIYKRVFGRDSKILNGCSRCILNNIKELAKVYFEDKAEIENKAENSPMDLIQPECGTTETITEEKPAKPKKNANKKK